MPVSLQETLEKSIEEARRISELASYKKPWKGYENFSRPPYFCGNIKGIEQFISSITHDFEELTYDHYPLFKKIDGGKVYNIPCSFDIETSSFYNTRDEKTAIMYVWQFGLNGRVIMGRTWEEFFEMLNALVEALELSDKCFLYIYVHNLAYEFQFIRKWFDWTKIFALKKRKVLYAQYAPCVDTALNKILQDKGFSFDAVKKAWAANGWLVMYKNKYKKKKGISGQVPYCVEIVLPSGEEI